MGLKFFISIAALCAISSAATAQNMDPLSAAHTQHRQGYMLHINNDYDAALKTYEKSAAMGLAKSELGVARILAFDRETQHDYVKALPWLLRAAAQRETHQGQGFYEAQRQANEALDWYCLSGAAEFPTSHPFAQDPKCWHGRGKAFFYGRRGVKKDLVAARLWLEKSIAAGYAPAEVTLAKLEKRETNAPRKVAKPTAGHLFFVLFMLLGLSLIMRTQRFRQFVYGLLYNSSA